MAGLVEKVKQSIRNRSRSRKSIGGSDYERDGRGSVEEPRRSNHYSDGRRSGQYQDGRPSGQYQDGRPSGQYQDDRVGRSAQPTSALHSSHGINDQSNKPLPASPNVNHYVEDVASTQFGSLARKPVSHADRQVAPADSMTSPHHGRHTSDLSGNTDVGRGGAEAVSAVPASRTASNTYDQRPMSNTQEGRYDTDGSRTLSERMDGMNLGSSSGRHTQPTGSLGVSDSIRQRNGVNHNEVPPVPAISSAHQNSVGTTNATQNGTLGSTNQTDHHMRLPAGFNPNRTEKTEVTTQWRPAVTQETVLRERTEILQEEITRDIHIHHYYTYTQPIKVVEVLPAKHYMLDHMTGIKTEIPAPAGWLLPEDMQTRQPDLSQLQGVTRHYLVNDQHPNGIPEAPPLRHKGDREHLHASQGADGYTQDDYHPSTKPLSGRYAEEREFRHSGQTTGRAL